jgi:cytochrome c
MLDLMMSIRRSIWQWFARTAGWRAFNISSDKTTGLGSWSDDDIVSYLEIGHAKGYGTASGPMGEAVDHSFSNMTPIDTKAMVAFLRTVPAQPSPDLPATTAPSANPSHKIGGTVEVLGKKVFEGACVSCHGWTGESALSPFATLTGAWAVNDPGATNVAQIVISGTKRHTPLDALSMPTFGSTHSDTEIAAVARYITARFGTKGPQITAQDVAELRKQKAQ